LCFLIIIFIICLVSASNFTKKEGYMNIYGHIFNIIIYVYIYFYKIFYRAIILN